MWKTNKAAFIWRIIYSVLTASVSPLVIILTEYLINSIETIDDGGFYRVVTVIFAFFAPNLIIQLLNSASSYWINPLINLKFTKGLNNIVLRKTKALDYECFDDSDFYDKYTRAMSEADNRSVAFFNQISTCLSNFLSLLSLGAIVIVFDYVIIGFCLLNIVVGFVFQIILNKDDYQCSQETTAFKRVLSYAKRVLYQPQFAKDLKMDSSLSELFLKKYNSAMDDNIKLTNSYGRKMSFKNFLQTFTQTLIEALTYIYLAWRVYLKKYTMGRFVALLNTSQQLGASLGSFFNSISGLHSSSMYTENLLTIVNYEPIMEERSGIKLEGDGLAISIENLSFKYKNSNKASLKNVNIKIANGEHIAIVGLNGAGKSTLVKLLCGLYTVSNGEIFFNGNSIMDLSTETIRKNIATVFQDFNLYGITLSENITRGKEYDGDRVLDCIKRSNFYDRYLTLPIGAKTILSPEFDGGITLSGGESQKIAIAAAFYKQAKLLIFDEPSSSLDPLSEHELFQTMNEYSKGKTTILVSHRLSNVKNCDRIYYMESGEIVEEGSHEELMTLNGKYALLYNTQADEY